MEQQTNDALKTWLSCFPESSHPCDMKRFFNVLIVAEKCGDIDNIRSVNLRKYVESIRPTWNSEFIGQFVETWQKKISLCADLIEYQRSLK